MSRRRSHGVPVLRRIGPVAPRASASCAVMTPTPCRRSRQIGCYIASDGSAKPYRMHVRGPSFVNLQCLPHMMRNCLVADAVAIISSVDPVLGEVDR